MAIFFSSTVRQKLSISVKSFLVIQMLALLPFQYTLCIDSTDKYLFHSKLFKMKNNLLLP